MVSNAVAAVSEIQNSKGKFVQVDTNLLNQLLSALPDVAEWGRVYILDFLAENLPNDFSDEHVTRIIPNLAHSNPALVLSAAKVILTLLERVSD